VITTLLAFIFVLGVLVFVHELGHFLVAKKSGMRVECFSLGFPPKAFGVTVGETEYCISWLPLGGYVKIAGMADFGSEEVKGEPWEFQSRPAWMRMSVMAAGPAMNFLLGFLLILGIRLGAGEYSFLNSARLGLVADGSPLKTAGLLPGDMVTRVGSNAVDDWESLVQALSLSRGLTVPVEATRTGSLVEVEAEIPAEIEHLGIEPFVEAKVGRVMDGSPAEGAGLQAGDRITGVAGEAVEQWYDMSRIISAHPDEAIELRWVRDGVETEVMITPKAEQAGDETVGRIGIGRLDERTPIPVGKAFRRSGQELWRYTTALFAFLQRLVSGEASGQALAGPLAIAQMAGQSARLGWESLLTFMALLSVNLAVLNLLPIPMLDGGHLFVMGVESAIRRPLSLRQKEILQQVGFAFLLFLMIYVTFKDLGRMFGWG